MTFKEVAELVLTTPRQLHAIQREFLKAWGLRMLVKRKHHHHLTKR
jgi:hypothetical protein